LSTVATGRFDQKLALDKQAIHVLNRLTFGPRPGDVAEVRRLGIEKWIDLQTHPERVPENRALEAKLKPLETVKLPTWQILDRYPQTSPAVAALQRSPSLLALQSLPIQQSLTLNNGSPEERRALLMSMDPDKRKLILGSAPPQVVDSLPDELKQ